MKRIELYDDYRLYLKDYFEDRKKRFSHFSHRYFCRKAGISSPSLYQEVTEGKRNLTDKTIPAFIKGLGLTDRDGAFFAALVGYNQSKTEQQRELYFSKLMVLRKKVKSKVVPLDHHEYYLKWYNPVIRELACTIDWKGDYALLAKAVDPPVTESEVRESIKLLLRLGFIKKDNSGKYTQCEKAITTGPNLTKSVRNLNRQFSELAIRALDKYDPDVRHISSMTIGVSNASLKQIMQEIEEFKDRVRSIVNEDNESSSVYDINIQLFPLTIKTPKDSEC
ncbi:TIGR02147 family protein [Chitinispirillales bacterium ANBcel5]|uniref:TIGR02147 family protein n=1 Tax=Cellulosispirillum alkaliphilum TaxID=3039283 RepID=UPI002A562376|nr:TIGR02147 family protein [Chitinispirillales bacterium ANBcel5]